MWVAVLDVVAVVAALVALHVLFVGPIHLRVTPKARLLVRAGGAPLLYAAALWLVRHALYRRSPLHRRLLDAVRRLTRVESLRAAWPPFVWSRLAVLVVGYVAVVAIGFDPPTAPWRVSANELLNLPARWDAGYYLGIVTSGYALDSDPRTLAFFPGFPALMYAGSKVTGLPAPEVGFVIVMVAFLWALTYFYRLAREYLDPPAAQAALLLAAFYPFGVYYCALFTESIFLLVSLGAIYHFRRNEYLKCACFGLIAGLVRPNGFLLAAPLGLMALMDFARSRGWLRGGAASGPGESWGRLTQRLSLAALPVAGVVAHSIYLYSLTGDPLAWMKAQQAWGRSSDFLVRMLGERQKLIVEHGVYQYARSFPIEAMEGAAALLALVSAWPITKRFGLPYGVFVVLSVVPSLVSLGTTSIGRYTAPLFPIFFWLGAVVPERHRTYWIATFAAGQALVAALFFTWRPPY